MLLEAVRRQIQPHPNELRSDALLFTDQTVPEDLILDLFGSLLVREVGKIFDVSCNSLQRLAVTQLIRLFDRTEILGDWILTVGS